MFGLLAALDEAEEQQSVPARSGGFASDGAQGSVALAAVLETILEHLHRNGLASIAAGQHGTDDGQPAIFWAALASCCRSLTGDPLRRNLYLQVGIIGDGQGTLTRPLRYISLGQHL